ncbi:precorrin-3B C(17)-methyltransferase [Vulcanococcus sp. Clear-D1]|uniref:precorrin-3B C(17)-methyltransferase n=1 Tax=Vulcanococcus sp. Clear-D1 TaxID=2766970 RepID=UPI0019C4D038|nr:precorrin-3B C(17)-methyltransferase [Vulcanococcus sp. Clear-D1]MBD1192737.1 precorrin-3B C(17)-methyltransferase [Vulcanococcus sp. Clear-D1]
MSERLSWGLSLSQNALPLLRQLLEHGLIDRIASPADGVAWQSGDVPGFLASEWPRSRAFVAIGACGAITRLIAPLLQSKQHDPAVVVADPQGRFAIPLLGGHGAGAEALAQAVAALLGGEAVLTGASAGRGQLALDAFGNRWGWRRGPGDWDALMKAAARGEAVQLEHHSGNARWLQLPGLPERGSHGIQLSVGVERGDHCRWHPPALWVGMGCERGTSLSLLQRCLEESLAAEGLAPEAVAGLASADRKADEPALLQLAAQHGWPLRCFSSAALNAVPVPNPSAVVQAELGTASVAEAAALLAGGPQARLRTPKRIERARDGEQGAATAAIAQAAAQWAPQRGCLHLIGSGPGSLALLTPDARAALATSSVWVGYGLYLDLLEPLRRPDQLRSDGQLTQERERCREALELACQGLTVALVSSGDSGIYGMAGLALEQWMALAEQDRPAFQVHPGISALQLAAARAGAPLMHDFCTVSLSDRLTPWEVIERRLRGAAAGDFVVALYNPRSKGRDWQLGRAQELLLEHRPPHTPVVLARQLGREEETVSLHELATLPIHQVDMLTLVLIGNSSSRVEGGRMVTPRGYPGAELS